MRIDPMPKQLALQFFHVLEPLFSKMCERAKGEYTLSHIHDLIVRDKLMIWVATGDDGENPGPHAVAGTQIEFWPEGQKVFRLVFAAADKMDDWTTHLKTMMDYARDKEGCVEFITEGRKGWARRLDLTPASYVYRMKLS